MAKKPTDRPSSKVARVIEEYDLDGMGAELEARWTAEGDDRLSLRDLADLLNRRLLEQALLEAGMSTLENDVETIYHNLTDDAVSTGVETDTRNRLQRNGVDVESVENDFVTYQAVRSYLREWRGAKYEGVSDAEKIEKDVEVIQRLQTRALSIAETRVENLDETGRIDIGDFEVFLDMQVLCSECGSQYEIAEFLERGGCDCTTD